MKMKRLLLPLALVALAACGTGSASPAALSDTERTRLLAAADTAAHANGGEAKHVDAVKTTRGDAADLTGHSNQNQDEAVWVVQVSGDHYVCGACSGPPGASAPQGDYITMVLRASDYLSTDGGLSPHATDLGAFGEVQSVRDEQ